jgi:hypothetical protein
MDTRPNMNQEWFEMRNFRRRKLSASVWIPLRSAQYIEQEGKFGFVGFREEFFGVGALAVSISERSEVDNLGWSEIGISHDHRGWVQEDRYIPADIYEYYQGKVVGLYLVLSQHFNHIDIRDWHLHQDFVVTLGLKREADVWVSPAEGYIEVVRLHRAEAGEPVLLEVRSEHLRDYLCARRMALYMTSYRSRMAVLEDAGHLLWSENLVREVGDVDHWEGRISEIHEGGNPFGGRTAVSHASRVDVDVEEDVPRVGPPTSDSVRFESWTMEYQGRKLYLVHGELWRNEWIEPATTSPRIRGDEVVSTVFFTTDADGARESGKALERHGRWLWFRPDVIMALAHRRGGGLGWHTKNTGWVRCAPDDSVIFGINKLGLVNIYAKDIALLPEWEQKIWAGYNIGPEGGVSEELLSAQMRAVPANTQAPEEFLPEIIGFLNHLAVRNFNFKLFRDHEHIPFLLERAHRFRAVDKEGLYSLAKDLARLTADSLDIGAIQKLVSPPKGAKWGSLKSLEHLLALRIASDAARQMLSPLVGIFELRNADAHLPGSQLDDSLALSGVDKSLPTIFQGYQLLHGCISSLYHVADVLEHWVDQEIESSPAVREEPILPRGNGGDGDNP